MARQRQRDTLKISFAIFCALPGGQAYAGPGHPSVTTASENLICNFPARATRADQTHSAVESQRRAVAPPCATASRTPVDNRHRIQSVLTSQAPTAATRLATSASHAPMA